MKKVILITLYVMVLSFGMVFGYLKNQSWNIRHWGYNSSKYVSMWWIVMGFAVTMYAVAIERKEDDDEERAAANGRRTL